MTTKLVSRPVAHLARTLGLVKRVAPLRLDGRCPWAIGVHGYGLIRVLARDVPAQSGLHRAVGWDAPTAMRFPTRGAAVRFAQKTGLAFRGSTA